MAGAPTAVADVASGEAIPQQLPVALNSPLWSQRKATASKSAPDSQRRHSLQLQYQSPGLWSSNTSNASLVKSGQTAQGEHSLDEATAAHRISALRQLNGTIAPRHRYAKSTGARNSTFSQPVIVRTYSGTVRPRVQPREIVTVKKDTRSSKSKNKMDIKLPPVEAFSFKGIMDEIKQDVTEDLERIAEICARSKYSLSNQYEVHMPPHGRGELIPQSLGSNGHGGPTLQAVGSDDEGSRAAPPRSRGGRRTKSMAYGTLETIMSSSRSSDEDQSKKKPAAVIAEEVRGRAAKKVSRPSEESTTDGVATKVVEQNRSSHIRSTSASLAFMSIDHTDPRQTVAGISLTSPTSLISKPARTKTSADTILDLTNSHEEEPTSPTLRALMSLKPNVIRNESLVSQSDGQAKHTSSILESLSSLLPWTRSPTSDTTPLQGRTRSASHAEGSLRELLRSQEPNTKGKGIDRSG